MEQDFQKLYEDAIQLLHSLITSDGILASSIEADNYKRIWSRDSIVCGLAGLWINDEKLIEGLGNSLKTLARYQHATGMIPSNVLPVENDVSYGSLVGRIDASTWFILGACLHYQKTKDATTWQFLKPAVDKCRVYLKACEFNDKGWIYTPLSGNWADEYPIHGYTLYDNVLRLWGEQVYCEIEGIESTSLEQLIQKTMDNFWPTNDGRSSTIYQSGPFETALNEGVKHFMAFILPGLYDTRFDAAGNALALLFFSLSEFQKEQLTSFIESLKLNLGISLIPAFWPIIDEKSTDWFLLKGNYSFDFKNTPGDFHNGGIWPVWMGLFCYGLTQQGMKEKAREIVHSFSKSINNNPDWNFQEYLRTPNLQLAGKTHMGYTASGIVFMKLALQD